MKAARVSPLALPCTCRLSAPCRTCIDWQKFYRLVSLRRLCFGATT